MNLLDNYYIIRIGEFATNANTKIYYCLFTLYLCLDDYYYNNSSDCLMIMMYSTLIWSFIECFLHMTNTRVIKPMNLYIYNTRYKLPNHIGIFLQGFQEGGCVTTIGLYFGDRLFNLKYFFLLHLLIGFIVCNVMIKKRINNCCSKRLVNSYSSVILMSIITGYDLYNLYMYPNHFIRQLKMLFVMIYVCMFWTYITWYKDFRKVEVYKIDSGLEIIRPESYLSTFLILSYDVIFEIGMAYLFFYNIILH